MDCKLNSDAASVWIIIFFVLWLSCIRKAWWQMTYSLSTNISIDSINSDIRTELAKLPSWILFGENQDLDPRGFGYTYLIQILWKLLEKHDDRWLLRWIRAYQATHSILTFGRSWQSYRLKFFLDNNQDLDPCWYANLIQILWKLSTVVLEKHDGKWLIRWVRTYQATLSILTFGRSWQS
jgi:hypothetical protein